MAMARGEIVAGRAHDAQFEDCRRAGGALKQALEFRFRPSDAPKPRPLNVGSVYRLHSDGVSAVACAASRHRRLVGMVLLQDSAAGGDSIEDAVGGRGRAFTFARNLSTILFHAPSGDIACVSLSATIST